MPADKKNVDKKSYSPKLLRVVGWTLAILLGLVLILLLAIQTDYVQNIARKEIVAYLNKKLDTKIEIKGLHVDFPKTIVLDGVFIQDLQQDTLLSGRHIKVDIEMYGLLNNELNINELHLEGVTAKIKRQEPDVLFNYQFIIDAFASAEPDTAAAMKMSLDRLFIKDSKLVYQDIVIGNDVDIYVGSGNLEMSTFDPTHLIFDIPNIYIDGLKGRISQTAALKIIVKNSGDNNSSENFLKLSNKKTRLKNFDLAYTNKVSDIDTRFILRDATVYPDVIDLEKSLIKLKEIDVTNLDAVVSINGKNDSDLVQLSSTDGEDLAVNYLPWKVILDKISLNDSKVVYHDNTKPILTQGLDFAHLNFSKLFFEAKDFMYHRDTVSLNITNSVGIEKSGFVVQQLQTSLFYTDKGATLKDLFLRTPGSEIKRNIKVSYPSLDLAMKDFSLINLNMDIENSKIQVADILTLFPNLSKQPAFNNTKEIFQIEADIEGSLAELDIRKFLFSGFNNTRMNVDGVIKNILDTNSVYADLNIHNASTSLKDIKFLAPPNSIPKDIVLPEAISLSGRLKGGLNDILADLKIRTSLGNASIDGRITNLRSPALASYEAEATVSSFQLGKIIYQDESIGNITGQLSISGIGYDPDIAKADIKAVVNSAVYNNYEYKNVTLTANLDHQQIKTSGFIKDPNIHVSFVGEGELSNNFPCFKITADIDSIKTGPLNLTQDPIIYRGHVEADFPRLSLDSLQGHAYISKSLMVINNRRIELDSIILEANYDDDGQSIIARTTFAQATIKGRYKLPELGEIFMNAIEPYYKLESDTANVVIGDYNFKLSGIVSDHSTLRAFLPDLTRMSTVTFDGAFSNEGWNISTSLPSIIYANSKVSNLVLAAVEKDDQLDIQLEASELKSGENINLYNTTFKTKVGLDKITYALRVGDKVDVDRYVVQGNILREPNDVYNLMINPDSLVLNYDKWLITKENSLRFGSNILESRDFDLSNKDQHLTISNVDNSATSPLKLQFINLKLGTFSGFLQKDSLNADGIINGSILIKDISTQPSVNADIGITNLSINKDTIGDLMATVNNNIQNTFDTNVSLKGRNNEANLTGRYYLKPNGKSEMDFKIDIQKLQMKTVEGLSMGAIREGKGYLNGKVLLKGLPLMPDIDGSMSFNDASMIIAKLNSEFKIDNEQIIAINNVGLKFDRFTVRDSAENRLTVNGSALTTNYVNYKFDLKINARNFQGLNSSRIENKLYYGKLFFDANLKVSGTEIAPVVDGTLKIDEDTDMTIVLPKEKLGLLDREGIVVFVDKDAPINDSLFLLAIDTLNTTSILGMDVSVNIEIDKKATLTMVIDEANGDFIKLKGEALLNGGIDKSGKITLTGSYELDEGSYEMSFNLIKRKFVIQKGSKITWSGEPTDGNMDVTAIYVANTNAADLVQDQVAAAATDLRYRQRLPFEVQLNMDGPLLRPLLTFEIKLRKETSVRVDSEISSQVEMRLNQINAEPSELSKQVYALLILNRFVADNPFASASGGFSAESMARQSVSKILSQQLNNLASNLVKGVELDFDVVSSEDYTSGSLENRTDLNVGVSKRLFNERLNVTVGTNIALEGGQQGNQASDARNSTSPNINIEYMLSKDGRYLLRVYRKNEFEGVVEGFVVETGIGFVVSLEYDKFKEIFRSKKSKKSNRNINKLQNPMTTPKEATDSTKTSLIRNEKGR